MKTPMHMAYMALGLWCGLVAITPLYAGELTLPQQLVPDDYSQIPTVFETVVPLPPQCQSANLLRLLQSLLPSWPGPDASSWGADACPTQLLWMPDTRTLSQRLRDDAQEASCRAAQYAAQADVAEAREQLLAEARKVLTECQ